MNSHYRKSLPGTALDYVDARAAVDAISPGAYAGLPYVSRVFAENLVRRCDPDLLHDALLQLIERRRDLDFPWFPARVVCHDILGQTALVDLAGLRDAIAEQGGDPAKVNPVVPVQLIVDHSLAVECGGDDPQAFAKNRAIEDRRNEDRFHFIDWSKRAFRNVDVIPPGNGIMHQINLEKMSPVIYVHDGVAFPDTCVGTDSHTPHVDALGVIAIGVGGLERESVMLGRASWMRLPDIVGVELSGRPQPGITATDVVLALTEFLRQERVVGAYLEFFGEGGRHADHRRPRHHLQHVPGIRRHRGDVLHRPADPGLSAPDRARGSAGGLGGAVRAHHPGCGPMRWPPRSTSACCASTCRRWCATWPARAIRTSAWRPPNWAARGIADAAKLAAGQARAGAGAHARRCGDHRRHHQLHEHLQPAQRHRRRPAGAQCARARPGPQAVGEDFAGAGLQGGAAVSGRGRPAAGPGGAGLRHRRLRLHHLQRHERCAGSAHPAGDRGARPVRHRGAVGQPQLRRAHPSLRQAGVPGLAAAGDRLRHRRQRALRHREGRTGHRRRRPRGAAEGPLAQRRRDRCGGARRGEAGAVPPRLCADVQRARGAGRAGGAAVRLAPAQHLHPPTAVLGRRAGRRAHAAWHARAGGARRQHHHRPPVAVQRDPGRQRRRRIPGAHGRAGGGLQFLCDASRRPPHRAARHLRQPQADQRNGGGRRQGEAGLADPAGSRTGRCCACGRRSRPTWRASSR